MRRRRFSPKRATLVRAYGKPWDEIALEWGSREDLPYEEIARLWTNAAAAVDPSVTFTEDYVSRTVREALRRRETVPA